MAKNAAELFDQIMGSTFPALMAARDPNVDDIGLLLAGQNPPKGVRLIPDDIGKPAIREPHPVTDSLEDSDELDAD